MKKYLNILGKSPIFSGIAGHEIESMLQCLSAVKSEYKKSQFVLRYGDNVDSVGVMLSGSVSIIQDDFWGNHNIVSKVMQGQIFAETYACTHGMPLKVSVIADEPSVILFLNVNRVLTTCTSACEFHNRLIRNLIATLAQKNMSMNEKLRHMAQRTTREKLLSYLSANALELKSSAFEIPFNRQQLADYLSVDRSAMSKELCKMRGEGLLEFDRNKFILNISPKI